MKILMHICCAPCAVYPLDILVSRGCEVSGVWFNPNIHPYTEYRQRLEALKQLQQIAGLDISYRDEYGLKEFLGSVPPSGEGRCRYCYDVRLDYTAAMAAQLGAEAFTTSLLVSPYQDFDMIKDTGLRMQQRHGVEFLCEDFRPGFRQGRQKAAGLGLYSQKYCGCIFSEMERYTKK